MLSNKNFSITNNIFNKTDDDNDDDIDGDEDYEEYYSHHHRTYQHNNTKSRTQIDYKSIRENNGNDKDSFNYNTQYYYFDTRWNEKMHQNQTTSSISNNDVALATRRIMAKDKKKNLNLLIAYNQNLKQQQQLKQSHQYSNRNHKGPLNWKNNSFSKKTANLSPLSATIENPPSINRKNRSMQRKRNGKKQFQQNQQDNQDPTEYEQKIFKTFSFQRNSLNIDPTVGATRSSSARFADTDMDNLNGKNNKVSKTLIRGMKSFTKLFNKRPSGRPFSNKTKFPKNLKISSKVYNDNESVGVYPETRHSDYLNEHIGYNQYDTDANINYTNDTDDDDDDEYDNADETNVENNQISIEKMNALTKIQAFVIEVSEEVSAHGFSYLAKSGIHILERIIWVLFIAISIFGVISLGQRIWDRFQSSPMVITMDRNKLVWNTSFPSLTVCPYKRIDETKVEEYMENRPKYFETEEDREMFREFVTNLANASYDNIETLVINKTFGIRSEKYLDLLHELQWTFSPEMSSGTPVKMHIYETITELGVCHAVNSMIARYNSYEYWKYNNWAKMDHGDKVTVHPLDGEIYAQMINLSTAYDVYFHGAMEIPDISKQKYTFSETDYTTVELTALEVFTADEAKDFSIKQRKCRFNYEANEMMTSPIYTFGICRTECRMRLALKVCNCVPHFYRNKVRSGQIFPVCGIEGFACLAKIKKEIISLKSDEIKIECDCQPNCDDSNFFVQSYKSRIWFLGANLQWGITSYPKMQLRREILFTFADVLVYIGGLAGFFLGCSILSFLEFMYFFTFRLVKRMLFK